MSNPPTINTRGPAASARCFLARVQNFFWCVIFWAAAPAVLLSGLSNSISCLSNSVSRSLDLLGKARPALKEFFLLLIEFVKELIEFYKLLIEFCKKLTDSAEVTTAPAADFGLRKFEEARPGGACPSQDTSQRALQRLPSRSRRRHRGSRSWRLD